MDEHLIHTCSLHASPHDCPDVVVMELEDGTVGIPVHDGGDSIIEISHCPWCGRRLAKS